MKTTYDCLMVPGAMLATADKKAKGVTQCGSGSGIAGNTVCCMNKKEKLAELPFEPFYFSEGYAFPD